MENLFPKLLILSKIHDVLLQDKTEFSLINLAILEIPLWNFQYNNYIFCEM